MSKFAPDVPKSLVDAVESVLNEAKVEPAKPDPVAVARKKKLDALRDKQAERDSEKEKEPSAVRKIAGKAYGGAKQKDEPELDEELKGGQVKLDKNHNGKLDADDFKKLRAGKKEEGCECKEETDLDEAAYSAKAARAGKDIGKPGKNFAKIAAKAGKRYGSAESGKKVAGAILAKIRAKHESVEIDERTLTPGETKEKEHIVKSMKKNLAGFKSRYGDRAKNVMYATATKMAKEEVEQIEEGRMKDIYTTMMMHADKQGYSSPKDFNKADYDKVGKEHGISGADVAIIAGHHTAHSYSKLNEAIVDNEAIAKHLVKKHGKDVTMDHIEDAIDGMDDAHKVDKQEVLYHIKKLTKEEVSEEVKDKKDLPFTPDKPHGPIAKAGKFGYGPSAAKHLAHLGMDSIKKKSLQKNSFDPLEEGTGGPIYTKPIVKLSDIMTRLKDARNLKKAKLVNNIGESPEEVNETMMGKAGCTSEEDKKKAEKPVDYSKYDKPTFLRKKDDWRKSNPAHLPKTTKEEVEHITEGEYYHERVARHLPKGLKSDDEILQAAHEYMKKDLKGTHSPSTINHMVNFPHDNDFPSDLVSHYHHIHKKNEEVELDEATPPLPNEISARDYARREKAAKNNKRFVAAVKRQKTPGASADIAKRMQQRYYKTGKWAEEVSIDETAILDKYISSMGYDPKHLDKNKKVMFAKTNAFKTFAASQANEGLYDGGQKGTQDIDTHMSPGATARG